MNTNVQQSVAAASGSAAFILYLQGLESLETVQWWDGHYEGKKITMKEHLAPALSYLNVKRGTNTSKEAVAHLLQSNLGGRNAHDTLESLQLGVLNKWHMKPFKGDNLSGLKEGLANEAHVLSQLPSFFKGADQSACQQRYEVVKILQVGLVESKNNERIGTSVDALCLLKVEHCGNIQMSIGCIEIKTKTTSTTRQEQINKLAEGTVLAFKDINVKYVEGCSNMYRDYVDVSDHRVQCLHHSAVFNQPICVYVVAEWKKIVRVVVCLYDRSVIDDHMALLAGIRTTYLSIYDHVDTVPEGFNNKKLGYLSSISDLKFSISLTNGLRRFIYEHGIQRYF
jgi:hypothetical protein